MKEDYRSPPSLSGDLQSTTVPCGPFIRTAEIVSHLVGPVVLAQPCGPKMSQDGTE